MRTMTSLLRCLAAVTLCLAGSLLLAGCFDVQESLSLNKDLSGKAGFSMTVDMEPMVLSMLRAKRESEGKHDEPTPAEIDQAKRDFLASRKSEDKPENEAVHKAELEKSLPPGVKLLDAKVEDQGLKMVASFHVSFDDVAKLSLIQVPKEHSAQGGQNPFDKPFANLKVVDEGATLLITSEPENPVAKQEEKAQGNDEVTTMVREAFKGLHIGFKIEAPFEVAETNATRREGHALYWDYDLAALERMSHQPQQAGGQLGVRVRFRKGA